MWAISLLDICEKCRWLNFGFSISKTILSIKNWRLANEILPKHHPANDFLQVRDIKTNTKTQKNF